MPKYWFAFHSRRSEFYVSFSWFQAEIIVMGIL
jgi:hypothetical protein